MSIQCPGMKKDGIVGFFDVENNLRDLGDFWD